MRRFARHRFSDMNEVGSSAKIIPHKMPMQPMIAEAVSRSPAHMYAVIAANTGSIAKIRATRVAVVYF